MTGKALEGSRLYAFAMSDHATFSRTSSSHSWMATPARYRRISLASWLAVVAGGSVCWGIILTLV